MTEITSGMERYLTLGKSDNLSVWFQNPILNATLNQTQNKPTFRTSAYDQVGKNLQLSYTPKNS